MNKRKTVLVLCTLLACGGLGTMLAHGHLPTLAGAAEQRPERFTRASLGPIRDIIIAKGTIAYDHQLSVRAPIGGRIAGTVPAEGRSVRRGQVLLRVLDMQDEHERALRQLEQQRCQQKLEATGRDVRALTRLVEVGSSAPYELEQKKLELDMTAKDCQRARIELARLADKEALGVVRSPLDGMVINAPAVTEQTVSPGEELLTLAGGTRPFIVSYLEATDVQRIGVGQAVMFSDAEDSQRRRRARVKEVARAIANGQRQNTVKIVIEPLEPIDDLRLSQQLYVEYVAHEEQAVLRIARELVYERAGQRVVNVLTENGVQARPISTAPGDASFDKIVAGIGLQDRLLPRSALAGSAR